MFRNLRFPFSRASAAGFFFLCPTLPLFAANVQIDTDETFQTIVGFGATGFFQSETTTDFGAYDLGVSMYRHGINARFSTKPVNEPADLRYQDFNFDPSQRTEFDRVVETYRDLKARRPEVRFVGTAWTPPAWMKDNNAYTGSGAGSFGSDPTNRLSDDHYDEYAKFLVEYQKMMTAMDMPLYAIGPQNEPQFTQSFDSCLYTGAEFAAMVKEIGLAFEADSSVDRPLIFGPEDMTLAHYGTLRHKQYVDALLADDVADYFDIFATHGYTDGVQGGSSLDPAVYWNSIKQFDRPYWITEGGTGGHDWPEPITEGIGSYLHYALAEGNASVFLAWQLEGLSDEQNVIGGPGQPTKKTYAAMHYWRFIRPGFLRVGVTLLGSDRDGILVSAYRDQAKRRFVVVAINTNTSSRSLELDVEGGMSLGNLDYYQTTATLDFKHQGAIDFSSGAGTVSLPARSMTTLVALEPVTVVSLSESEVRLDLGSTVQLSKTVLPSDATDPKVTWESSDPDVVSVDGSGILTGRGEGTATISIRSRDGGHSASASVEVGLYEWAHWSVDPTGWVNTGDDFLGWIHVRKDTDWIYSLKHEGFLYLPEAAVSAGYAWMYLPRYDTDTAAAMKTQKASSGVSQTPVLAPKAEAVTNVARGKTATASSYAGESTPQALIDGHYDEASDHRWTTSGFPQWIVVDLGALHRIAEVRVRTYQGRDYRYTISISTDGVDYTQIVDRSDNLGTASVFSDSVDATGRYVRMDVSGAGSYPGDWCNFNELELMGYEVTVPVTGISLSRSNLVRAVGQSYDLDATISPAFATNQTIHWSSNDEAIATVSDSGKVTGVSSGTTVITARTDDGDFFATTGVTVNSEGAWGPWTMDASGAVNTGSFIGWVYVRFDSNWVFLYELGKWAFLPEKVVERAGGAWVLISVPTAE
jgi:uncharacterized protein YjdB